MHAATWTKPGPLDEAGFMVSRLHHNAVIRSLEVIGEASGKVSPGVRAAHPQIPWREITGMRHRLIHGYADVRLDPVWSVVTTELDPLAATLSSLVPEAAQELLSAAPAPTPARSPARRTASSGRSG